jgi:hypothetical protein
LRSIAAAVVSAFLAVACSGDKRAPAPAGTPPAAGAASEGMVSEGAAGEFGVPECDRFASKYLACLDKVPEGGRALARQTFEQTIEHWRLAAEKPERRASLAAACAQQEKATRAAMSRYDCDW